MILLIIFNKISTIANLATNSW